jgi:hypothetical protein
MERQPSARCFFCGSNLICNLLAFGRGHARSLQGATPRNSKPDCRWRDG